MPSSRLHAALAVSVAAVAMSAAPRKTALDTALPLGWTEIGQVVLDRTGCVACPATFSTESRPTTFALASDSPFPVDLAGRFEVQCADASTYHEFLSSPGRKGVFQLVRNLCMNYDSKSVTVSTTTVSLSPPDADRRVVLTIYGAN